MRVGRHVGYLEPLEMELPSTAIWPLDPPNAVKASVGGGDGSSPSSMAGQLVLTVAVDGGWNRTEDPLWGAGTFWNQVAFVHVAYLCHSDVNTMIGHVLSEHRYPSIHAR